MRRLLGSLLVVLAIGPVVGAQTPDRRLTVTDVERISGLTGLRLVAKTPSRGAGGDLNFAGPDGQLVLMANFGTAALYDNAKKLTMTFHGLVPGLGDEAFDGPAGSVQYAFYVKKGASAFSLATFFVPHSRPMRPSLTMDQLKAAAKIILSRM